MRLVTRELDAIQNLIHRLRDEGVLVAVVGGAARDVYLSKPPKDYDIVILDYPAVSGSRANFPLLDVLAKVTNSPITVMGNGGCEAYFKVEEQRGLVGVYEAKLGVDTFSPDAQVQFLHFSDAKIREWAIDPANVVEEHDCSLNKAYMEEVEGRLVPRVTPDFPSTFTGNLNVFDRNKACDLRVNYIINKFPEFSHV